MSFSGILMRNKPMDWLVQQPAFSAETGIRQYLATNSYSRERLFNFIRSMYIKTEGRCEPEVELEL
jgi:hypothetical protein